MKRVEEGESLFDIMARERIDELLNPTRNPRLTLPIHYAGIGEIVLKGFSKAGVEGKLGEIDDHFELPIDLEGLPIEEFLTAVAQVDVLCTLVERESLDSFRFRNYKSTLIDSAEAHAIVALKKMSTR